MDSVAGNTHDALNEAQVLSPEDTAKAAGVESIEDIPAKFRNEDGSLNQRALLNSYLNLEAKQGRDSSQEVSTEEGWEEKPKEVDQDDTPKEQKYQENPELSSALAEKGVDMQELTKDFYANDETLSQDWYDKLETAGYSKQDVDMYVAGVKATNAANREAGQAETKAIMDMVGGDEGYNQMMDYFDANGGSKYSQAYNDALNSNDLAALKAAVGDMYLEYRTTEGAEPNRRVGGGDANQGQTGYRSQAEMLADMKDPRYSRDPAFRADVERRAVASRF